ncbi:MAG: CCA tRNA nucleotidyltransferase [Phycisphaerales bacterium]
MSERDAAVRVIRGLRERDHVAYLAGGCVRDMLLGYEPKDFDVATDARPEQIEAYFRKTASVGAAFGVVLVRDFGATIEVATFRSDGVYSDARRPDSIEFSSPEMDAQRRDFTINALFLDPESEEVIDFVDGRRDIEARVLRAVGDPDKRLQEDHLRALRAVRFAARYGLTIEANTAEAIRRHAFELRGVSIERIGDEMRRMLLHPSRTAAIGLIDELGLDDAVFGDVCSFDPGIMGRLGVRISYGLALAALALGRGQGIDEDSGGICRVYRERLDLSNADRDALSSILEIARSMHDNWEQLGVAGKRRLAGREHAGDALSLFEAWCAERERDDADAIVHEINAWAESEEGVCPPALIDGGGLIDLGMNPGPRFREILDAVYDAQLEGRVRDRQGAIELAKKLDENPA